MKRNITLRMMIMAAGLLGALHVCGETQTCRILSVEVSKDKELTIEALPAAAKVTYSITSEDARPVSGPSGLTIQLTGKYQLECHAWTNENPQSVSVTYNINWKDPEFLTDAPD